jgi:hypothetical protein
MIITYHPQQDPSPALPFKGREALYQVIIQDILNFLIHMIVISSIFTIIDKPAPSHSRGGSGEGSLRIKNTAINIYWYESV